MDLSMKVNVQHLFKVVLQNTEKQHKREIEWEKNIY